MIIFGSQYGFLYTVYGVPIHVYVGVPVSPKPWAMGYCPHRYHGTIVRTTHTQQFGTSDKSGFLLRIYTPLSLSLPFLAHSQFVFIVFFSVFLVTCLRFHRLFTDKITYVIDNTTNERDVVFSDLFDERRLLQ